MYTEDFGQCNFQYIYLGKTKSGAPQFFAYCMAFTDKLINVNARTRARTLVRTSVL